MGVVPRKEQLAPTYPAASLRCGKSVTPALLRSIAVIFAMSQVGTAITDLPRGLGAVFTVWYNERHVHRELLLLDEHDTTIVSTSKLCENRQGEHWERCYCSTFSYRN